MPIATRINFSIYFWSWISFGIFFIISLIKIFIFIRYLKLLPFYRIVITITLSSLISYFGEYFISLFLNHGNTILVWIPWVKLLDKSELWVYLVSFPFLLAMTIIIESSVNILFLKNLIPWKKILRVTSIADVIILIILIIFVNIIIFNIINGIHEGYSIDLLQRIK
jgi:hypothetical protein